jgi:hypothetical protein
LREPGFQRVSGEGKRILPPVSRVLPSVLSPAPVIPRFSRASWFRKSRFSGGLRNAIGWHEGFGESPGSDGRCCVGEIVL